MSETYNANKTNPFTNPKMHEYAYEKEEFYNS